MTKRTVLIAAGALVTVGAIVAIAQVGPPGARFGAHMMRGDGWQRGANKGAERRPQPPRSITKDEYDARTRERFARLDRNGDGVIDAAEIEAGITQRTAGRGPGPGAGRGITPGEVGAAGGPQGMLLRRFDSNHDGKVTKDEFLASVKKRFAALDLNNDGRITDDDLPPMMRGRGVLTGGAGALPGPMPMPGRAGRGGPGGQRVGGMIGMLAELRAADANKDGIVTLDEVVAAATKRFDAFDKNKDGVVDQADFELVRKENVDYAVKRFLHRYGADQDGKVTRAQFLKAAEDRFAELDTNKDGRIDRQDSPDRAGPGAPDGRGPGLRPRDGGRMQRPGPVMPGPGMPRPDGMR